MSERQRYTVKDAAEVLGVTVSAIRMRIQRGTLRSEKDASGRVYVWLTPDDINTHSESHSDDHIHPATRELIDELRSRIESLESANRENRRIIAALTQRIPAIEPPAEEPPDARESPVTASEEEGKGKTPPKPENAESRSWWRRIFQ